MLFSVVLIVGAGLAAGALSMGLYKIVSPQRKIGDLRTRLAEVQRELKDYEGDFSGMIRLLNESLRLSLKRVGWTLGPSLLAGVPVLGLLFVLRFSGAVAAPSNATVFGWAGSWLTLFLIAVACSALTAKIVFRIH